MRVAEHLPRLSANLSAVLCEVAMKILVSAAEGAELLDISLRAFHSLRKDDAGFPAARSLGPRNVRFVRSELEAYAVALPAVRADEPPQLAAARVQRAAGRPVAPAPFNGLPA